MKQFSNNIHFNFYTFPDNWKKYRVCSVCKQGAKNRVKIADPLPLRIYVNFVNYLNCFPKFLNFTCAKMYQNSSAWFYELTVTMLLSIILCMASNLDKNFQIGAVHTDLSKTFNHNILLQKLTNSGLVDLFFFNSYLSPRTHYVEYHKGLFAVIRC